MLLEAVRSRVWATVALLAASILLACGGESTAPPPNPPPPPPPPPSPTTATVEVKPDSSVVVAGDTVRLTATAKDAQGNPIPGRPTTWATNDPAVATVSTAGLVTAIGTGFASISATADGKSGSAVVRSFRPDTLAGAATALAGLVIPRKAFVFRPADYKTDHPALTGLPLSFNTVSLSIEPGATVAEINAVLLEFKAEIVGGWPAATASLSAGMVIRLPTNSHVELIDRLAQLRTRKGIRRAAPDVILSPTMVSRSGVAVLPNWSWDLIPAGSNWGLEAIRAPQLWNLNAAIAATSRRTMTGVLDVGFEATTDLKFADNVTPHQKDDHGNFVAGIAGATFDNAIGIDGISPFADLVVSAGLSAGGITGLSLAEIVSEAITMIESRPDLRVLNLSLGYQWGKQKPTKIDPRTNSVAMSQIVADGQWFFDRLADLATRGRRLPVIVASAGNDRDSIPGLEAKYNSPFANASLVLGVAPVIVVEAVGLPSGGSVSLANFSDINGHVSAPGVDITSTLRNGLYGLGGGTSFAAPFVTGLISYLYALDPDLPAPTMSANPIRDLLIANGSPVSGASPMIDAFASALDLDRLHANDRVLRLLLDIDDGTVDGNLRVFPDGTENIAEDADGDGFPGDGVIDMADFRRWRDWLLLAEHPGLPSLDGSATHRKKDLNGDGTVSPADNIYARGDFNGDGEIDRGKKARMRGNLGGLLVTDLEVLRRLFVDTHYQASDLPSLIESWDLTIDGRECLKLPEAIRVNAKITPIGDIAPVATRDLDSRAPVEVVTIAMTHPDVSVRVEAYDDLNSLVGVSEIGVAGQLGSDELLGPACLDFEVATTGLPAGALAAGYSAILRSVGGTPPVSWSIASGSLPPGLTLSGAGGAITGTPTAAGTFSFTARAKSGSLTANKALSIVVTVPPLRIAGFIGAMPGTVGVPFDIVFVGNGGDGTYRWAVAAGNLPAGLTLNGTTGRVAGTPTVAGTSSITMRVTSAGLTATGTLSITINAPSNLRIYAGRYTDSDNGAGSRTRDAWLLVYPSAAGNTTCFLMMIPTRQLTNGLCRNGDFNAWEGTLAGPAITATSTSPGRKAMRGTMTDADVSFTGDDPFGKPLSFTSTARVQ